VTTQLDSAFWLSREPARKRYWIYRPRCICNWQLLTPWTLMMSMEPVCWRLVFDWAVTWLTSWSILVIYADICHDFYFEKINYYV